MVPHSSDQPTTREYKRVEAALGGVSGGVSSGIGAADPWVRALLDLPALVLAELPEPIVLHVHVPGAPGSVLLTTCSVPDPDSRNAHLHAPDSRQLDSRQSDSRQPDMGVIARPTATTDTHAARAIITFDRDELRALVLGVEADRIWHREFLGFCFEKWRAPAFRVSSEAALGGANPDPQIAWSSASFLRRLQARLTAVECVEDALASDVANANPRDRAIHGGVGRPLPLIWAAA